MRFFPILIFFALCAPAAAEGPQSPPDASRPFMISQLFDTDARVRKADGEKIWFFALSGMYARKNGNTDTLDGSLSSSVRYDDNIVEGILSYSGSYGETRSVRDENKGSVYCGLDWYLLSRFELFFYSQSDYDRMTELLFRDVAGAGGKLVFVRNRFWKADLSGAPVYQFEKYSGERAEREWRWSVRGRITLAPESDLLRLQYVYFYIPSMGDSREYRQSHDFSASLTPVKALLMMAGYRRDYDASVPEGKKKADSKFYAQAGISL